jgi:DNA-binding HxlR family transcriptional regulator
MSLESISLTQYVSKEEVLYKMSLSRDDHHQPEMKMQNHKRAVAGSSRRLDQHGAAVESGIIIALTGNVRKDFSTLLRDLAPVSQSVLAAGLVSLCSDGWTFRNPHNGRYCLTSRALDMLASAKRSGRRTARRAA